MYLGKTSFVCPISQEDFGAALAGITGFGFSTAAAPVIAPVVADPVVEDPVFEDLPGVPGVGEDATEVDPLF